MSAFFQLDRVREALAAKTSFDELQHPRRAAVALVLSPSTEPEPTVSLLLVRRSEREGDPWSGHMALPGGHAHVGDATLEQTARRETLEEVGVDLSHAELLGRLDDVSPLRSSELLVRPFVFWTSARPAVTLSDEVAEVVWVPLEALGGQTLRSVREVTVRGNVLRVPAYVIGDRIVWGMTFHLLDRFLRDLQRRA